MGFKKKSGLLVGAGFLLGTVGVKALTSTTAKKCYVQGVAQGLRAKATYENIVEQAKAEVDDIVAEATYISVGKDGAPCRARRRGRRPAGEVERDGLRHRERVQPLAHAAGRSVPADDLDALYRVLGACPAVERANVYLASAASPCATVQRTARGSDARSPGRHRRRGHRRSPFELRVELAPHPVAAHGHRGARGVVLRAPVVPAEARRGLVTAWRYAASGGGGPLARAGAARPVLDAAAGMSFVKRDPRTAGETMLLLNLGETLEEYALAVGGSS
ncbi:MAG: DUF6110 family protein [Eggerthella lenta]